MPDPYTTITAPGNSPYVITAGAYDAYSKSIYLNSGRGYTRNQQVKPDLCAPGVKVSGPGIRDSYVQRDGTSVAAALTAGSCALLMLSLIHICIDFLCQSLVFSGQFSG